MTISVRPAAEADLPALLALYAELHPGDTPLPAAAALPVWTEIQSQRGRVVLLAEQDGKAAGTADCTVLANLTHGGRPFMLIENVVVARAHRRAGVGTALLDAAAALARPAGCYKAQLLSRADRTGAHAFYEACGFAPAAQGYRRYFR
ncbi:MAG: N-acetyltransferase family protein [Gemmatimonadota bacterium]